MFVVFDTQFVALLLHPGARPPDDRSTGKSIDDAQARIEYLVESLEQQGATVLIPTPALAEFLVLANQDGPAYLSELNTHAVFRIEPFDELAAVESAAMENAARARGDKKGGGSGYWQKVKIDRQVVAIAKTREASCIYSDDEDIIKLSTREGISVIGVSTLPAPPARDGELPFNTPND